MRARFERTRFLKEHGLKRSQAFDVPYAPHYGASADVASVTEFVAEMEAEAAQVRREAEKFAHH